MKSHRVQSGRRVRLSDIDPGDSSSVGGNKAETKERTLALQQKVGELQELLYAEHKHKILIILQGMDTSGKDGAIRSVLADCSPQGVRVVSFKKPTEEELDRDYLWRVHKEVPGAGELVVFNRSHYEDALVVRVHSKRPQKFWNERFREINELEAMLAASGTLILKFFLHISPEEQRERLQARIDDPTKRWKFQHGDLDERKLWNGYMLAYEDAIGSTSTKVAPWYIVPADAKWVRNYVVARTVVDAMQSLKMRYPEPDLSNVVLE
jgi:PPK2 family polyphosphate:nucleotide phosphotransferase